MAEAYMGEIRMMGFNFNPRAWAKCDGAVLSISSNQELFTLIGNTYHGGDGVKTFALPDLRGRIPIHSSNSDKNGYKGGIEAVSLEPSQMPEHTHSLMATMSDGNSSNANKDQNSVLAQNLANMPGLLYGDSSTTLVQLSEDIVSITGGQAHSNMQPTQVINFCICISGQFPSRNEN